MKYWYNGLHWRTQEIVVGALTGASGDKVTAMYYSPSWQLLWEETDESSAGSTSTWETKVDKTYANLYGLRGLDDLICRCIDGRTSGGTAPDGTYGVTAVQDACYVTLTDPQFSVREVMEAQNGGAIERWRYSAYGEPESLDLGDYNLDGMIDFFDYDDQYYELASPLAAPDDMRADVNGDGILDFFDADAFAISYDPGSYSRPMPKLRHKYCGYLEDATSGLMLARFRWYSAAEGRWIERDPIRYPDGMSAYQYLTSMPTSGSDPQGMYDEAGHFYTTFLVLNQCGLGVWNKDMFEIAYYSQLPDESPDYDALELSKTAGGLAISALASPAMIAFAVAAKEWYYKVGNYLHSLHGGGRKEIDARRRCLEELLGDTTLTNWQRGFIIHALADSYAHTVTSTYEENTLGGVHTCCREEAFSLPIGHGAYGHTPDHIETDVDKYKEYVRQLCRIVSNGKIKPAISEKADWSIAGRRDDAIHSGVWPKDINYKPESSDQERLESKFATPSKEEVSALLDKIKKACEGCAGAK